MKFYVPKESYEGPHEKQVYAISDDHHSPGWVTCGFVSKQTLLGQGIYCRFPLEELREATRAEVLDALKQDHPHGADFRPHCMEAMSASFHLAMSKAVGNWTNDKPGRHPPIHDVSRQEIVDYANEAQVKHDEMLGRWDEITAEQRSRIQMLYSENKT